MLRPLRMLCTVLPFPKPMLLLVEVLLSRAEVDDVSVVWTGGGLVTELTSLGRGGD